MPAITPHDRICNLKTARVAAQAVVDEIKQLNLEDADPAHILGRKPAKLQAQAAVDDLSDAIDNEGAATCVVTVNASDVTELGDLAGKLDKAIAKGALRQVGLATLTTVLNSIARVREVLDA